MDRFLDVKQVSEMLNIKQSTLRNWILNRRIPYVHLNKLVRFKESDLTKWIGPSKVSGDESGKILKSVL